MIKVRTPKGLILILLVIGGLAAGLILWINRSGLFSSPEQVVRQYMTSVYAQDYEQAYQLISEADKVYKSKEVYLRENNAFTGFTLEAARQLASYIDYPDFETDQDGDRATLTMKFIVPDGNAPAVRDILFAASSSGEELSDAERQTLLEKLDELHQNDQIPTIEGEQTFDLVKEQNGWRIFENWTEAVRVHFSGEVMGGLAWEFEPLQETVLAKPGETFHTAYRAKNLSDRLIVAKARHIDEPEAYRDFLNIIQCFCFIQESLNPDQEVELPLVFRIDWDIPPEVKDFYVHYEFYPIETFPEDSREPVAEQ